MHGGRRLIRSGGNQCKSLESYFRKMLLIRFFNKLCEYFCHAKSSSGYLLRNKAGRSHTGCRIYFEEGDTSGRGKYVIGRSSTPTTPPSWRCRCRSRKLSSTADDNSHQAAAQLDKVFDKRLDGLFVLRFGHRFTHFLRTRSLGLT